MQTTGKSSKRLDLQGIRGLAIIVVLGFHFYPNIFPNGYLGVDQFFVLSGFLMCMLLKRGGGGGDNMQSCSLITLFYSKRFKRILPLYLLIILSSLLSLYTIFPDTAVETNTKSAEQALLFMSNRPKSVQENYFELLAIGMDIFTHTWSLSVEIQFYFIVPFLFIIGSLFPIYAQYLYYSLIGISSFLFYSISDDNTAFNSVFARIWQFTIGMIVYMISQTDYSNGSDECCEKLMEDGIDIKIEIPPIPTKRSFIFGLTFKYFSLLSLVYITTYPIALPVVIVRPYVTILTGLLMLISMDDYLLSNRILTYIGDISYSLYLIHWPIYAYWKLTMKEDPMFLIFCLITSVLIAVLCYELFERWYISLSSVSIGILVVTLFAANIILINKDSIWPNRALSFEMYHNMSIDQAKHQNKEWTLHDNKNLFVKSCHYESEHGRPYGWCNQTGLGSISKYRIALIGNSWAANVGNVFYQECHQKAKSMLQGGFIGCEPFYPNTDMASCPNTLIEFAKRIEYYKPDILFIIARYFSTGGPITDNNLDNDKIYQVMRKQLNIYMKSTKHKIFILEPIPHIDTDYVSQIVDDIRNGTLSIDMDKKFVDMSGYIEMKQRYGKLFEDCGNKCERIDYVPEFYDEHRKTFRYFDDQNGLSYFTGWNHMTPYGIEKIRHIYTDICSRL